MKRFEKVEFSDLDPIECCCGTTRRAFVDQEDAPASAHYLEVADESDFFYD
jgi:hypothetical protein